MNIITSQIIRRRILISSVRHLVSATNSVPSSNNVTNNINVSNDNNISNDNYISKDYNVSNNNEDYNIGKEKITEMIELISRSDLSKIDSINLIHNVTKLEAARKLCLNSWEADRKIWLWKDTCMMERLQIANAKVLSIKGSLHARGAMEAAEEAIFRGKGYKQLSRGASWKKYFKEYPNILTNFLEASKVTPCPAQNAEEVSKSISSI
ncbi:hypothetical protein BC937DRAFT_89405, partial [Endogone sp. FLAS-F59071]